MAQWAAFALVVVGAMAGVVFLAVAPLRRRFWPWHVVRRKEQLPELDRAEALLRAGHYNAVARILAGDRPSNAVDAARLLLVGGFAAARDGQPDVSVALFRSALAASSRVLGSDDATSSETKLGLVVQHLACEQLHLQPPGSVTINRADLDAERERLGVTAGLAKPQPSGAIRQRLTDLSAEARRQEKVARRTSGRWRTVGWTLGLLAAGFAGYIGVQSQNASKAEGSTIGWVAGFAAASSAAVTVIDPGGRAAKQQSTADQLRALHRGLSTYLDVGATARLRLSQDGTVLALALDQLTLAEGVQPTWFDPPEAKSP